jgi:hypothetical protein
MRAFLYLLPVCLITASSASSPRIAPLVVELVEVYTTVIESRDLPRLSHACAPDPTLPPIPRPDEHDLAREVLAQDPELGERIREGKLISYAAMPPLVPATAIPRAQEHCRILAVGVRSAPGTLPPFHEIVGVNISLGRVIRFAEHAPPGSRADEQVCGFPSARQRPSGGGLPGSAILKVTRGGHEVWRFRVVRPSASAGILGSGIELRDIHYRNKLVMKSLMTPILNVEYADGACGPYRDWEYDESPFKADGVDVAPGVKVSSSAPQTLLDNGSDEGDFRGVAVHSQGDQVRIVSELEAGWYRYVPEILLKDDGTIQPRWSFTGVENSCVCHAHNHHVYWRFDIAVGGSGSQLVESQQLDAQGEHPPYERLASEFRYVRKAGEYREFRFRNTVTGEAYTLSPGNKDGRADRYARADTWILNPKESEISDGRTNISIDTEADLDRFLDPREALGQESVVVWYSAHFNHDEMQDHEGNNEERAVHVVGPNFHLRQW